MLNELDFSMYKINNSTKNINSCDDTKSFIVTINLVLSNYHKPELTELEKLLHETNMINEGKMVKLSASYSTDKHGKYILPIKIAFKDSCQEYKKRVYFERDLNDEVLEDIVFIEKMFDTTETEFKRVYM